jgi:pheromone shutdown protein TraB
MPGEEFRVALQEAHACGAQICFGDRPVQVRPTDLSSICTQP